MNTTIQSLLDQFTAVVDTGDEQAARKFLVDHIKEFPEELQQKIIFAFFEEALEQKAENIQTITTLQKEALAALSNLEKAEKQLTIESNLGMHAQ